MKLNNNKSHKYIKLSSNQKFDMSKNRKEKYLEMFLLINSSIGEVKNISILFWRIKKKKEEIFPFQNDLSSITLYNFSEIKINGTKNETTFFKKIKIKI